MLPNSSVSPFVLVNISAYHSARVHVKRTWLNISNLTHLVPYVVIQSMSISALKTFSFFSCHGVLSEKKKETHVCQIWFPVRKGKNNRFYSNLVSLLSLLLSIDLYLYIYIVLFVLSSYLSFECQTTTRYIHPSIHRFRQQMYSWRRQ